MEREEQRANGIERVKLNALVEICGNEPGIPAFEGECIDVSGRGMGLKTSYVPEVDAPLVLRFEHKGREVLVEGAVAWRREHGEDGEFGVRFTALDSGSVDALRELSGMQSDDEASSEEAPEPEPDAPRSPPALVASSGAKVRLHIDGLGTPMKACVRDGSDRKVHVGSNLEFLKVGRRLELEDPSQGARRGATIDAVSVALNPQSQIPELIVTLRYEGCDRTPEPSVVDHPASHPQPSASAPLRSAGPRTPGRSAPQAQAATEDHGAAQSEDEAPLGQDEAIQERLEAAAHQAGRLARSAGEALASATRFTTSNANRLLKGASEKLSGLRHARPQGNRPRRTAPPPSGGITSQAPRLRQQGSRSPRAEAPAAAIPAAPVQPRRARRIALGAVLMVAAAGSAAFALRRVDTQAPPAPVVAQAPKAAAKAAAPVAGPAAPAAQPTPVKKTDSGIIANVPLFGPTTMATTEAAPAPAAEIDVEAEEKLAAAASVPDESWDDQQVKPEDVKPWGRGKMHLPTIHKLQLDGPGTSIKGAVNANGFTVVIPGRKVQESGRAIARRDQRIATVSTSNTAAGASVTFKFRGDIPPYRVRLRKDAVEFLVSAPR